MILVGLGNAKMESKFALSAFLLLFLFWEANAAVDCTATGAGRFADPNDSTCTNYTLCVFVSSTRTYMSYNYSCPTNAVFNPSTSQCTASGNYVCNVTTTNSTTSDCTAEGFFPDPSSNNCSSYIQCVSINGNFTEDTYTCPGGTLYNPNTTLCDFDYSCPTATTPAVTCTAAGRFANATDTSCKTYNFCVLASSGTYLQYSYTCPGTSVFDPFSRLCTTTYPCIPLSVG